MAGNLTGVTSTLHEYLTTPRVETPQQRFNANFITSQEIIERVGVTRPAVLNRMSSRFPSIKIGNTYIWEKTPEVENFVQAWAMLHIKG